ncbi:MULTISPECIES: hypothetical protein [unclassified Acinetobacter]|uniref:hypothetical protein n=1 Tax=unclassified Acinetobacter TaxID=196816 RepID=UPI0015D459C5|nr:MULTISPECIES: hypothetical protein [unclassified Acinetobacter]
MMVDRIASKENTNITAESEVKNQQDVIIKENYIKLILNATNHLPMKVVRTEQDMIEFLED